MAKATSKPAGAYKVPAGPSGKMQKFTPVGAQKPGVSSVSMSGGGGGGGGKWLKGGPSGKMQKFKPVGTQKPGVSGVSMGKK